MLRAVFFDVGETLIDETRQWERRADEAGVSRFTFMAVLGGVIGRGLPHTAAWPILEIEPPDPVRLTIDDLYPDVRGCLQALRAAGLRIGLAGNQPRETEDLLRQVGEPADFVASSASIGFDKPDPRFFAHLADAVDVPPEACAYVGDRIDNDVVPALAVGMTAVFVLRGPWAYLQQDGLPSAAVRVRSLAELPDRLVE
jgi:HAD superfamily hydrolase (TIGR01509 family)